MALTRENVFAQVRDTIVEMFGLPIEQVTEASRIRDDLDLDSIDMTDLTIRVKATLGGQFSQRYFNNVSTIGDVVDALYALLTDNKECKSG